MCRKRTNYLFAQVANIFDMVIYFPRDFVLFNGSLQVHHFNGEKRKTSEKDREMHCIDEASY